jgi:hypothetical protein
MSNKPDANITDAITMMAVSPEPQSRCVTGTADPLGSGDAAQTISGTRKRRRS